jgi:hypothetical protein
MKIFSSNKKHALFTQEHYGKWVALSSDRKTILDASHNLSDLTQKFGTKEVIYTRPLDPSLHYAF